MLIGFNKKIFGTISYLKVMVPSIIEPLLFFSISSNLKSTIYHGYFFQPGHSVYKAETNEFPLVLPVAR